MMIVVAKTLIPNCSKASTCNGRYEKRSVSPFFITPIRKETGEYNRKKGRRAYASFWDVSYILGQKELRVRGDLRGCRS